MNNLPAAITLCEVGLRDGLQNEKTILSTEQKVELLRGLIDAGFRVIEGGPRQKGQGAAGKERLVQAVHPAEGGAAPGAD